MPLLVITLFASLVHGTENATRKPFAEWANLPEPNQLTVRLWYMEGEAYHVWYGRQRQDITVHKHGEDYGIDPMQGMILLEYGLAPNWAADLNVGYGTVGSRSFNANANSESATGFLDTTLGVRYQIWDEEHASCSWQPTLTFRAGAILPGRYNREFPFAPGNRSAAIEPSFLVRKHVGWKGFGVYGDVLYRWMRTSGDDQYMASFGFFQEVKNWTLSAGYRHFQQLSGYDLTPVPVGSPLAYSPQVREISDAFEAGFQYVTPKSGYKLGFFTRKTFDGSNTDSAFLVSAFVEFPFGGSK
ncbi:MAG TPA: transporter [Candidatus Saccharimonadales bacterium]|nr:transporter [Candidatus Saccharimonadales bacterium]